MGRRAGPDLVRPEDGARRGGRRSGAARGTGRAPRWQLVTALVVWVAGLGTMCGVLSSGAGAKSSLRGPVQIPYATFMADVGSGKVKSVVIDGQSGVVDGALRDGRGFRAQGPAGGPPAADLALLTSRGVVRDYAAPPGHLRAVLLEWLVPIGLLGLLLFGLSRRSSGQMARLATWSRSGARVHDGTATTTTFADVAGYEAVKREVRELVEFLREPKRFEDVGARMPKGVLLVGPPGTGKTLLARAVAGEAGVPFVSVGGAEFMEMFVGVGAARVRDVFRRARAHEPSILFVDEIDAVGRRRGAALAGGQEEREQTLNQILSEMDGFEPNEGVIVMAATNRPDVLDPALLRPGRFDRQVVVPLPSLDERRAILEVHSGSRRLDADVDLDVVARSTPGLSGAELGNLVNEAALIAVRRGASAVGRADLDAAHDRVLLGVERASLALAPEEKRLVAHHEAGHALVAELLAGADPVRKVTILPAGLSLGATHQVPGAEHHLEQLPALEDAIAVRLGGREAELLAFGVPSTGAQDDLASATGLAGRMVREWGMSEALGPMAVGPPAHGFPGGEPGHDGTCSPETARIIDEEVARILARQASRVRGVLEEHRDALDALASALEDRETLQGDEVRAVVAGRSGRTFAPPAKGRRDLRPADAGPSSLLPAAARSAS